MRGTLTFAGQRLTAALIIAISFSAPGCMDSATVNPVAELASLTVTPGALQPAFTGGTTQYTVDLTREVTSVRITAQPAVAGDTITINGQATTSSTIALGQEGSTTSVSIVVSESSNNSRTYIVLLKRASLAGNNSLQSLAVSPGTLAPAFNANTQNYSVDVADNIGSVTVTPTLSDPAATMTVNGNPGASGQASTVSLNGPGKSTVIPIVVTAQNGNEKTYQVSVNRGESGNNFLESLTISPGTLDPVFSAGEVDYRVDVANNITNVTVTATPQDANANVAINGQNTGSRSISLGKPGTSTLISIVVTAQNDTEQTYRVTVNRGISGNNNLQNLTLSPETLSPAFSPGTVGYTVNLPANLPSTVTSMTVTPTLQDADASMTVNGQATNSGQARTTPLPGSGENTAINIVVTAQNGTTKTYSINVIRAALSGNSKLESLVVSPGILAPTFNASTTSYTVDVASDVTSVTVTATLSDTNASMMINGQGTSSGQARVISLGTAGSSTNVTIIVTAPNGSQETYTITVNQAASSNSKLVDLTVSSGSMVLGLTPAFNPDQLSYTADAGAMDSVTVSATKADPNAVMSAAGSVIAAAGTQTGQVTISPPRTDVVITVIAQDQLSTTSYTITVNRAP